MNAKVRAEIDCLIEESFWPALQRGLEGTDLYAGEEAFEHNQTRDKSSLGPSRELTFLILDPFQPIGTVKRPAWLCRGNLECSLTGYILSFDFHIELPVTFSVWKIIELIGNPLFSGNPPKLCVEHDSNRQRSFLVSFDAGRGAEFGLKSLGEAAESIERRVRANARIIDCVEDLYQDLESSELFLDLHNALLAEYEAS
jgi:hypothetical protein